LIRNSEKFDFYEDQYCINQKNSFSHYRPDKSPSRKRMFAIKACLPVHLKPASSRSGQVTLGLDDSISLHSTLEGEELIIPLSGSGKLTGPEMGPVLVEAGSVLYNPPRIWHRVSNTGNKPLVYLYVCALPPDEANRVESSNV